MARKPRFSNGKSPDCTRLFVSYSPFSEYRIQAGKTANFVGYDVACHQQQHFRNYGEKFDTHPRESLSPGYHHRGFYHQIAIES
jgi:hypothetical protein